MTVIVVKGTWGCGSFIIHFIYFDTIFGTTSLNFLLARPVISRLPPSLSLPRLRLAATDNVIAAINNRATSLLKGRQELGRGLNLIYGLRVVSHLLKKKGGGGEKTASHSHETAHLQTRQLTTRFKYLRQLNLRPRSN